MYLLLKKKVVFYINLLRIYGNYENNVLAYNIIDVKLFTKAAFKVLNIHPN